MPLMPAALAFVDQYRRSYRWRVQLFASLLNEGVPFDAALEQVPGILGDEAKVLVRTGLATGTLPKALRGAAALPLSRLSAWGGLAGRVAYLGWVLLVMQTITGFVLYFIIPKFEAIFKDFGVPLPQVTTMTIEASHFLIRYFYFLSPILLLLEVFVPLLLIVGFFGKFTLWWDVPLIDYVFRRRHSTVVLRALGLAIAGGKPITSGIVVLSEVYPSGWVRRRLREVRSDVENGLNWVDSLRFHRLIRPAEAGVLESAARVGNLEWALNEIADSSDRRLGYRLQFWLQFLTPLVLVGLGSLVFLLCVSFFIPLVNLIGALS